jgi:hypothetical protein
MKLSNQITTMAALLAGLLISGCASDDESSGDGLPLAFMSGVVKSLPQTDPAPVAAPSASPSYAASSDSIDTYSLLASFFEQECFMPGADNYCPADVDTSGGDSNPHKFTSYTLLGLLYHAQMYSGGQRSSCDQGSEATIDATSFVALNNASGDADKYILDYNSLLNCLYEDPASDSTSKQYQVYSYDVNGEYQATLTTRNRVPYNGVSDPGQNDVFQVYVSNDSEGTPVFLAFNYAGADTVLSRTILLVNLTDNKFAVKHSSYNGSTYDTVVSIGIGGVDIDTGTPNTGYYMVKFTDNGSELEKCIDNATGLIETDMTSCSSNAVPTVADWTTSSAVSDYLGMTATQMTHLSAWLTAMGNTTALGAGDTPTDSGTGGDPDYNLPRTVQAAQ